jgi:DNA-binding transcriptional ArsR family regulator
MSRWFRVYDDLVDDPKVQRLSGDMVKSLLNLWCLASQNDGMLPAADDIAFKLRMTPSKVAKLLSVLGECGLIDSEEEGLRPHNWNGRQYKSDVTDPTAALRQKAYRERNKTRDFDRNGAVTVTDTRTDTEADTEADTEQKEHCPDAKAPRTKQVYSDEFESKFWQPYPRTPTMSKSEAWKAWMKLTPEQRVASCQAIEPYRRHLRSKPNLETVHACRFLSQERYAGFVGNGAEPASTFDIRSHLV